MAFEKFTIKSREAIAEAQRLAGRLGNPEIRCGHLLAALLNQDGGVVPSILQNVGVKPDLVIGEVANRGFVLQGLWRHQGADLERFTSRH